MKTYTITQQTIRQLHELGDDKVKAVLKDEFGEALYVIPEIGKWHWLLLNGERRSLIFAERIEQERVFFYGFDIEGKVFDWVEKDWYHIDNHYEPATDEEVYKYLKKHFKSLKIKAGDLIQSPMGIKGNYAKMPNIFDYDFDLERNEFWGKESEAVSIGLFHNGKWATIVKEPQIPTELQQLIEKHGKAELLKYLK